MNLSRQSIALILTIRRTKKLWKIHTKKTKVQ